MTAGDLAIFVPDLATHQDFGELLIWLEEFILGSAIEVEERKVRDLVCWKVREQFEEVVDNKCLWISAISENRGHRLYGSWSRWQCAHLSPRGGIYDSAPRSREGEHLRKFAPELY